LDADGAVRQIAATQAFADIVTAPETAPNGYEIRFYTLAALGDLVAGRGVHEIREGHAPFVTWRVENPDPPACNRLRIAEIREGAALGTVEYAHVGNTWTMAKGDGQGSVMQMTAKTETQDENNRRVVTETVSDGAGNRASVVRRTYRQYEWGEEIVREAADPDGANLETKTDYYAEPGEPGYSKIRSVIRPDGSWIKWYYDSQGRMEREVSSWLDSEFDAPESAARVTTYAYTPVDPEDQRGPVHWRSPRTVTESIAGRIVAKTYYAYIDVVEFGVARRWVEIAEQCATPDTPYGDPANTRTRSAYHFYGRPWGGEIIETEYPDGTGESYVYEMGCSPPYQHLCSTSVTVTSEDGGRRERTVFDRYGEEKSRSVEIRHDNEWIMTESRETSRDRFGRPVRIDFSDGTHEEIGWSCCGKSYVRERNGMVTRYEYDELKRVDFEIREGVGEDIPDLREDYEYDAAGRTLSRTASAGGLAAKTETKYDLAGRVTESTDKNGLKTTWEYPNPKVTIETRPGGVTVETERHADGRLKRVGETGLPTRWYWYGVTDAGERLSGVLSGSMWKKTYEDALGRVARVEKSGFGGATETHTYEYGPDGRLAKTTAPGLTAPTHPVRV